ncbi:MAG: hypothetical protein A2W17_06740 [Planctomycetes bacterium RBG_16_41_13]|nr:MAG: hypothetical protein A2W17_06740 [Planctomycetes bacterium RBG_16_41_13]
MYHWLIRTINKADEDDEYDHLILLKLQKGVFSIFEYHCHESGYDETIKMINDNIDPEKIIEITGQAKV